MMHKTPRTIGTNPYPNYLPLAVVVGCRECDHVWIQTLGYTLANPMAIARCPRCDSPVTVGDAADVPITAEARTP